MRTCQWQPSGKALVVRYTATYSIRQWLRNPWPAWMTASNTTTGAFMSTLRLFLVYLAKSTTMGRCSRIYTKVIIASGARMCFHAGRVQPVTLVTVDRAVLPFSSARFMKPGLWINQMVAFLRPLPPDHLLLDKSPKIGPLVSCPELDELKNCWNKSFRTSKILTLLYQQFSNLLISQRDMSGPRLGALSNNRWSGDNFVSRFLIFYSCAG